MNADDIVGRAKRYIENKKRSEFIPGETYITSSGQYFDSDDVGTLVECALGEWYAEGRYSNEFEKDLRTFYHHTIRSVVLANSGSSANLLAISTITDKTFGQRSAKPGDEIITVAAGFPTTINPIIQNALVPVFVDVNLDTLCPDMEVIENAIVEGKTKGVILAHPLGNPYDIESLRDICNEYGIWLIEDNCLVGETKVVTNIGQKHIKDIKVGDYVLTRQGYKKVLESKKTGYKKVIRKFGIIGTPDHPVITKLGTKRLDTLSASDIIYVWNEKLSSIVEKPIIGIPILLLDSVESIIGVIPKLFHSLFIDKFGLITLEKYLTGIMSTIRTTILSIIFQLIWSCLLLPNTLGYTSGNMDAGNLLYITSWSSLNPRLLSGIKVKTVKSSTKRLQRWLGKISKPIQKSVECVGMNIKHIFRKGLCTVLENVRKKEDHLADVYNLLIEDSHEFFANGILVHNCDGLGGTFSGKLLGSFGDISTLSFYPAHHLTAGEGGACLIQSPMVEKVLRSFRDWGKSCFPAGTLINVCEKQVPIESVKAGDFVLTHSGTTEEVTEVLRRKYSGNMYRIKPSNLPEISCTQEHPFYVLREDKYQWVKANELTLADVVLEKLPEEWAKPLDHIHVDYTTLQGEKSFSLETSKELYRLMGYYLAEGNIASGLKGKSGYAHNKYKFYRVDFSFHKDEQEYIQDVRNLMGSIFGCKGTTHKPKNSNGIILNFKSRKGYEFFKSFGTKSWNKFIPYYLLCCSLENAQELITGYWRGDGSSASIGYSYMSASSTLANQIRRMLLRFDIISSYSMRKTYYSSNVNGKDIDIKHPHHWVNIYGLGAVKFNNLVGESEYALQAKEGKCWIQNGFVHHPISKITTETVSNIDVYNLEVEDSHSYHANSLVVHNCWCPPGKDNTCGKRHCWQEGELPEGYDHKYTFSRIGYNLKATDLQASLLVSQLKKLPFFVEKRRRNWELLRDGLDDLKKYFRFHQRLPQANPSWFGFLLTVKESAPFTRRELIDYLEAHKIGTRLVFGGNLLRQPAYANIQCKIFQPLINSDVVMNYSLWIGVHPSLNDEHVRYMIDTIHEFVQGHKHA